MTALVLLLLFVVVVDLRDSLKELQHLLRDSETQRLRERDELLFDVYTAESVNRRNNRFLFQLCFCSCSSSSLSKTTAAKTSKNINGVWLLDY